LAADTDGAHPDQTDILIADARSILSPNMPLNWSVETPEYPLQEFDDTFRIPIPSAISSDYGESE
jgi:hypothetical protein